MSAVANQAEIAARRPDAPASPGRGSLLAALSGALCAAAFPPYGLPVLLPFGAAGLLMAIRPLSPRHAFYAGTTFGAALFGGTLFWMANLFGVASVSLVAICALFPGLFSALLVWLRPRSLLPLWLLAPLLWTGVEVVRSEVFFLRFGWMGFGLATLDSAPIVRIVSALGGYGATFLVMLIAALMAGASRARWKTGALAGLVWAGAMAMHPAPASPERTVKVRMVQAMAEDEEDLQALSQPLAGKPDDLILWPEYSLTRDPTRFARTWRWLQGIARSNRAVFVFGAEMESGDSYFNTAYALGPDGERLGVHRKNHLVHFVRDGLPSREARAINTPAGRLGVAICFDMDYPDVARRLAQDGAELFVVPNMDPAEWGGVQRAQHRQMFRMRAAECGRWLVRADVAGGTSVAGPNGVETARIRASEPGILRAPAGRIGAQTLFVRGGWLFGPLCLTLAAAATAFAFLRRVCPTAEPGPAGTIERLVGK